MFCQRCGNTLAPGARFCNKCGTAVTAPAAPISTDRPSLVTVIAILHFVGGAILLIMSVVGLSVEAGSTKPDHVFGLVLAAVFLLLGALSLATGFGLWKMREWGRMMQIVLASFGLLAIGVGTIISVLLLVYFTRPQVKLLFSGKRLDQMTPEETAILATQSSGGSGGAVAAIVVVVVLVLVAFSGIIAAIAIPNLLTAMQRSRQVRTLADMNRVKVQVEEYQAAHNAPPESVPLPKDAWGNNMRYAQDGTNYWIVSAAKDGKFEEDDFSRYTRGATTNFDSDIVLKNGEPLRWPERLGGRD